MPESHTTLSTIQAVTFIILVTINHTWAILRIVFKTRKKRLMGNAFVKIALYFSVPHGMTFKNKCPNHNAANHRILRGSRMQVIDKAVNIETFIMLVTSHHTKAI